MSFLMYHSVVGYFITMKLKKEDVSFGMTHPFLIHFLKNFGPNSFKKKIGSNYFF